MNFKAQASLRAFARRRSAAETVGRYYDKVAEREIAKVITDTCDKAAIPYMRNYQSKIYTDKASREKRLAKIPEHQKGKPDFTVLCLAKLTMWVETKSLDGKLGPHQLRWKEWIIRRGHEYHAPRTPAEAHAVAARILEMGR